MSSGRSSPINVASPISVNVASPVIATSPVDIAPSPDCVTDGIDIIKKKIALDIVSPINRTPPPLVASTVKAESPESHCSAYSTVYSPVASNPNVDADCCGNSSIKVRRQRLRPWLIAQINSGEIPGLIWLDKENMIFKIPWKHFGRPGVDMYLDALLFRRWAVHTKKFEQGRPSDISTWKTRFRCALHKLPDIEELNDQNQTEGEEPYRVYKFRKIELEKIPRVGPPDDEPESSIGSVGSPVSAYPLENTTFASCPDSFRSPTASINSNYHSQVSTAGMYKQGIIDNHVNSIRKRHPHRPKLGMATPDIQKWQYYDQMRNQEYYAPDQSSVTQSEECVYDDDGNSLRQMPLDKETVKEDNKYQTMDYETDDDDTSWNSRNCISINQPTPIQSVPSIVSRYPQYQYYSQSSTQERGFEPYERHYRNKDNGIGVIKNLKSAQKRSNPDKSTYEEDDNELFFQSCAKRIKKLDSKSSGYLKLKILEQFYYVENFQQSQYNHNHQSYRYCTDPPPLISGANVRTTEQVIDVDDSMHTVQ